MSCCGPKNCHDLDEDREGVSAKDAERFGGDDIDCPKCGGSVYFDASQCAKCGHSMMERDVSKGTPAWVPLTAAVLVIGIVMLFVL
jgi:uncharacterized protein (DUF983 family)